MAGGVILLASPCEATRIVFHRLERTFPGVRVVLEEQVSRAQLVRGRLKRLGAATVVGQLLFQAGVQPVLQRRSAKRLAEIREQFDMDPSGIPADRIQRVRSANHPRSIELLRRLAPAVVVVSGTRILSRALLSSQSCPFINMHAGITPLYRGVHGGYWALANGRPEDCGVTVHLVDPGVDTGRILGQARIHPEPSDCFTTYPHLQLGEGLPLLEKAVADALAGKLKPQDAPAGESRLWTHPTIWQYGWSRLMRGAR